MTSKLQKDIFLAGEGDAWVERNRKILFAKDWVKQDLLFTELSLLKLPENTRVLEIGCGEGSRMAKFKSLYGWECHGIEPSKKGVEIARSMGINAVQGTADKLPWDDSYFDLVLFGFCLYLCDRADLFKIAAEADRVLRKPGWLSILDFYSKKPSKNAYEHYPGLNSYKMDYRKLFDWHPLYECYQHKIVDHVSFDITDEENNWIAVSILRKKDLT